VIDALPAWLRHLGLVLFAAILGWLATDFVPMLGPPWGNVLAALVTVALAWVTPVTRQYGLGRAPAETVAVQEGEVAP
jgi:hypothetical protein